MAAPTAAELARLEEHDIWAEYLAATRNQIGYRYEEIEPWAWSKLRQRLKALRARVTAAERKR